MPGLDELAAEISSCQDCELARTRTNAVPGTGPANAEVVFVGEAPGFNEDKQGQPFVGQAGQFLNDLIRAGGMERKDVFICNIIKCRPPDNRDPLPHEVAACRKYLERQLELIQPKLVVTLGRHSLQHFLPGQAISKIHGRPLLKDGQPVMPMYHPAAALHQGSLRSVIIEDFKKLPDALARARLVRERVAAPVAVDSGQPAPEQGRLF